MVELIGLEARAAIHAALADPTRLAVADALILGDASPGELGERLGLSSNLLAHHLKVLEGSGLVRRVRSEADQRRTYVRLAPVAPAVLNPATQTVTNLDRVVFVCTHNSARSQFAAALWDGPVPAASAGTDPSPRVHPRAIKTARRHDLALNAGDTRHVSDVLQPDDLVVAVCDNAYEELGRRPALHWSVPDPARIDTDDAFEAAFAEIAARIGRLAPAVDPAQGSTQ